MAEASAYLRTIPNLADGLRKILNTDRPITRAVEAAANREIGLLKIRIRAAREAHEAQHGKIDRDPTEGDLLMLVRPDPPPELPEPAFDSRPLPPRQQRLFPRKPSEQALRYGERESGRQGERET